MFRMQKYGLYSRISPRMIKDSETPVWLGLKNMVLKTISPVGLWKIFIFVLEKIYSKNVWSKKLGSQKVGMKKNYVSKISIKIS